MSRPKAYEPQQGYQFQILVKLRKDREWEHCDYAKDKIEKNYLLGEYSSAYGMSYHFKTVKLPMKYWKVANESL